MILAYLRNPELISPDYKNGIKSRLREELILKAEALEFSKEFQKVKLGALQAFFVSCTGESKKTTLDSIFEALDRIEGAFSFVFGPPAAVRVEQSRERTVKILELLNKKGLVGVQDGFTPEKVREIIEQYRNSKK